MTNEDMRALVERVAQDMGKGVWWSNYDQMWMLKGCSLERIVRSVLRCERDMR